MCVFECGAYRSGDASSVKISQLLLDVYGFCFSVLAAFHLLVCMCFELFFVTQFFRCCFRISCRCLYVWYVCVCVLKMLSLYCFALISHKTNSNSISRTMNQIRFYCVKNWCLESALVLHSMIIRSIHNVLFNNKKRHWSINNPHA